MLTHYAEKEPPKSQPPKADQPEKEEAPAPAPKQEWKTYTFGDEVTLKCEHGKIVVKGVAY